ncbi:MAG: class I SAM-dependent methyltransferase [Candidatus Thermoplasmatota archaeon]|nr:class I SAM-dependent methyltransferase [Candidatus Thermoplasmatota archaeon]
MDKNRIQESMDTWNTIAESFHQTRKHPWDFCSQYIRSLPLNTINADLGCGNGRHLILLANKSKQVIGLDISEQLIRITKTVIQKQNITNTTLVQGDLCQLPFKSNSLDHVLYIAALHNIRKKKNRITSLKELYRVLKPGGTALVSVWSRNQERFQNKHLEKNKDGEPGDVLMYWTQHKLHVPRFYHLYQKEEFINDIQKATFTIQRVEETHISSQESADNYYAILAKS